MIAKGDFHLVIQSPTVTDPRLVGVARHCFPLPSAGPPLPARLGSRSTTAGDRPDSDSLGARVVADRALSI